MSRYLTTESKVAELAVWRELIEDAGSNGFTGAHDRLGGRGYVDREIVALVDALNLIEGVCTLQSCAGHDRRASDGGVYPAEVWLRLSEPMARAFYERAADLGAHPAIEQVALLWGRDRNREIVDIVLSGDVTVASVFLPRWFSELRDSAGC